MSKKSFNLKLNIINLIIIFTFSILLLPSNSNANPKYDYLKPDTRYNFRPELKLRKKISGEIRSTPEINGSYIYFGSLDHNIYSINYIKGTIKWRYKTRDQIYSSPCVHNEILYIGSNDGILYALNRNNGNLIWSYETNGPIRSAIKFYKGKILFGSKDNNIYCIDANSGKLSWKYEANGEAFTPSIAENICCFCSEDKCFYALDFKTGKLIYKYHFKTLDFEPCEPICADGKIVVHTRYTFLDEDNDKRKFGMLYLFDIQNKTLLWKIKTTPRPNKLENEITSILSPIIIDHKIILGLSSELFAVNAYDINSGKMLWRIPFDYEILTPLIVLKKYFILGTEKQLFAFDSYSSIIKWIYKLNPDITPTTLNISNNKLIMCTKEGDILFFSIEENLQHKDKSLIISLFKLIYYRIKLTWYDYLFLIISVIFVIWFLFTNQNDPIGIHENQIRILFSLIIMSIWILCSVFMLILFSIYIKITKDFILIPFIYVYAYPLISIFIIYLKLPSIYQRRLDLTPIEHATIEEQKIKKDIEDASYLLRIKPPKIFFKNKGDFSPQVFGLSTNRAILTLPRESHINPILKNQDVANGDKAKINILKKFMIFHELSHIKNKDMIISTLSYSYLYNFFFWIIILLIFHLSYKLISNSYIFRYEKAILLPLFLTLLLFYAIYISSFRNKENLADARASTFFSREELNKILLPHDRRPNKKSPFEALLFWLSYFEIKKFSKISKVNSFFINKLDRFRNSFKSPSPFRLIYQRYEPVHTRRDYLLSGKFISEFNIHLSWESVAYFSLLIGIIFYLINLFRSLYIGIIGLFKFNTIELYKIADPDWYEKLKLFPSNSGQFNFFLNVFLGIVVSIIFLIPFRNAVNIFKPVKNYIIKLIPKLILASVLTKIIFALSRSKLSPLTILTFVKSSDLIVAKPRGFYLLCFFIILLFFSLKRTMMNYNYISKRMGIIIISSIVYLFFMLTSMEALFFIFSILYESLGFIAIIMTIIIIFLIISSLESIFKTVEINQNTLIIDYLFIFRKKTNFGSQKQTIKISTIIFQFFTYFLIHYFLFTLIIFPFFADFFFKMDQYFLDNYPRLREPINFVLKSEAEVSKQFLDSKKNSAKFLISTFLFMFVDMNKVYFSDIISLAAFVGLAIIIIIGLTIKLTRTKLYHKNQLYYLISILKFFNRDFSSKSLIKIKKNILNSRIKNKGFKESNKNVPTIRGTFYTLEVLKLIGENKLQDIHLDNWVIRCQCEDGGFGIWPNAIPDHQSTYFGLKITKDRNLISKIELIKHKNWIKNKLNELANNASNKIAIENIYYLLASGDLLNMIKEINDNNFAKVIINYWKKYKEQLNSEDIFYLVKCMKLLSVLDNRLLAKIIKYWLDYNTVIFNNIRIDKNAEQVFYYLKFLSELFNGDFIIIKKYTAGIIQELNRTQSKIF